MGYMHIDNLYKNQAILLLRQCFALEKIHGTSAHVARKDGELHFYGGGEKHDRFAGLFDQHALRERFAALGHDDVTVFGEAYGGKQQAQAWRYGPELRFVAFDVRIGETWLDVPDAHDVANKLGLEFVHYVPVSTDIPSLNAERDAPSEQARRNGVAGEHPREGVVLRPLTELRDKRGNRIIAKHKRDDERETRTPRKVIDPGAIKILRDAESIALEWVTDTRLAHVLDHLGGDVGIERTRDVIAAMIDDVVREGAGEIVDSKAARHAISARAALMFKARLKAALR